MGRASATELFDANLDRTYQFCLFFFTMGAANPDHLRIGRLPEDAVQKALQRRQHVVTEWDYPRRFVVQQDVGPAINRTEMSFHALGSEVEVTWAFSIEPKGILGSLFTAIPRRQLGKAAPEIRKNLRKLKNDLEYLDPGLEEAFADFQRAIRANASDEARQEGETIAPSEAPTHGQNPVQPQSDAVRKQGEMLLTGTAFFEAIQEALGKKSESLLKMAELFYYAGHLHLSVAGADNSDEALAEFKAQQIADMVHVALSGAPAEQQNLSGMLPYYTAWGKKLLDFGTVGLMGLHERAQGNQEIMARLLLEYAAPPPVTRIQRVARESNFQDAPVMAMLQRWAASHDQASQTGHNKSTETPPVRESAHELRTSSNEPPSDRETTSPVKSSAENKTGRQLASVLLYSTGENQIRAIRALSEAIGAELDEALELAESAPVVILRHASREEAERVERLLRDTGADACII